MGGSGGALGELWEALAELREALGELWEGLYIQKLPINRPSGRYVMFAFQLLLAWEQPRSNLEQQEQSYYQPGTNLLPTY